jgi:WYL domain
VPAPNSPPLLFDDEQAVALTVALQTAATTPGSGLAEAAERALNTVRLVLPSRLRHRINALSVTAVDGPTSRPAERVDGEMLLAISAAVHAHDILRFDHGSDSTKPARRVEPHHVITWNGRWYLIAWDLDRDDWRTFRAHRIALRTPNGPRFTPRSLPGKDLTAYVTSVFRGSGDASGNWPCQGTVILDLPAATVALHTREGLVEPISPSNADSPSDPGPGPASPPPSADTTPTSPSSAPTNSPKPSRTSPADSPEPRPATSPRPSERMVMHTIPRLSRVARRRR